MSLCKYSWCKCSCLFNFYSICLLACVPGVSNAHIQRGVLTCVCVCVTLSARGEVGQEEERERERQREACLREGEAHQEKEGGVVDGQRKP